MTQHLSIVTGASRGLGLALARALLARGHRVLAISRQPVVADVHADAELQQWPMDLADPAPAAAALHDWLTSQDINRPGSATLINNAGVISEPAPLSEGESTDLARALRVGLEAPILLTAAFLKATSGWAGPRKVVLVSSGLGRRAMAGSAAYCAAKAGLDHLARALALEEAVKANGARVVSLVPGVIDTAMQLQLRSADPSRFAEQARFQALHDQGQLDTPARASSQAAGLPGSTRLRHQPGGGCAGPTHRARLRARHASKGSALGSRRLGRHLVVAHVLQEVAREEHPHAQHEHDHGQAHQAIVGRQKVLQCVHLLLRQNVGNPAMRHRPGGVRLALRQTACCEPRP